MARNSLSSSSSPSSSPAEESGDRSFGQVPMVGTDFDPNEPVLGKVICEEGTPNLAKVQFRLLPGRHTTIGRVVGVRGRRPSGEHILTLVRVENVWEYNPHEDALSSTVSDVIPFETRYSPEGKSTVIYRAALSEPLEEVVLASDGAVVRIDAVETLPLSGSPVVDVPPPLIAQAINFAASPEEGFHVGALHGLQDVLAILRRGTIQTHVFFTGSIGQGKSFARGVLAEELAAHGIPQINIDPMGEMIEATEALKGLNVQPGSGFTLPLSALESDEVIDAVPAIHRGTNIETLVRYAHDTLLRDRLLKRGAHFGVSDLVDQIRKVAPDLNITQAATVQPALLRAQSLEKIDFIGDPFPWEREIRPGRMINIDCRGRLVPDLRLIAASVARDLQRLAKAGRIPFVVLSVDEAHLVAPNDDHVVTTQVFREIARIGRHYRIGLVLTTQSPADMDRSVLKRLLTRFIFAIEPDQLDALRGVFADAPEAILAHLPKLPIGTCVITGVSETVKHATVVDIRRRHTPVGGRTPDIFADLVQRGWKGRKAFDEIIVDDERRRSRK